MARIVCGGWSAYLGDLLGGRPRCRTSPAGRSIPRSGLGISRSSMGILRSPTSIPRTSPDIPTRIRSCPRARIRWSRVIPQTLRLHVRIGRSRHPVTHHGVPPARHRHHRGRRGVERLSGRRTLPARPTPPARPRLVSVVGIPQAMPPLLLRVHLHVRIGRSGHHLISPVTHHGVPPARHRHHRGRRGVERLSGRRTLPARPAPPARPRLVSVVGIPQAMPPLLLLRAHLHVRIGRSAELYPRPS
ncbi:hypothetical protein NEOLEDRAFT_492962 [Neolentinus lepideus HHB14362 ss-1]|uniref:Uncharacterized protein n=1 Tax=Neolentinus lepideus HHB14362 ss-1 TaxID=1314782 RepID=A0A165RM06_9AGAM|nr:hypothetical protein NEOLEDRAFT_492962 [Neolentinus lepideus HHB14362 ss-1]